MTEFRLLRLTAEATLLRHVLTGVCDEERDVTRHFAARSAEMAVWLRIDVHGVDQMVCLGDDIPDRTSYHVSCFSTRSDVENGDLRVDVYNISRSRHNPFLLVVDNGSKTFAYFVNIIFVENAIFFPQQSIFH